MHLQNPFYNGHVSGIVFHETQNKPQFLFNSFKVLSELRVDFLNVFMLLLCSKNDSFKDFHVNCIILSISQSRKFLVVFSISFTSVVLCWIGFFPGLLQQNPHP